ncbi:MAG: pyridoxamine 5'-phosphate oxidase family protein [Cryobacterium sp.]|nr:pyridoxamine 5'-phosphate oxidase family protein [Oligoflexia bacterium]
MAKKSLKEISKKMRNVDLCMMTTITSSGMTASRPMSNNGDVEYDGNSYFFTWEKSRLIKDLKKNNHVNLSFKGKKDLFISVAGKAKLVHSRTKMEKHWVKDLDVWFEDGLDTPGIVMIHVLAKHVKYWQKEEEGEVKL